MAVRVPLNPELERRSNERVDKYIGRIYFFWLIGIFVGTIKLKPEKYSVGGFEFSIANGEILQGLIFLGCIVMYIIVIGLVVLFVLQSSFVLINGKRRAIYAALGKRKTLRGLTPSRLKATKQVARIIHSVTATVMVVVLFFPLLHILVFEHNAIWQAVKVMFGRTP